MRHWESNYLRRGRTSREAISTLRHTDRRPPSPDGWGSWRTPKVDRVPGFGRVQHACARCAYCIHAIEGHHRTAHGCIDRWPKHVREPVAEETVCLGGQRRTPSRRITTLARDPSGLSETAVCEKSRGLPGMVAETCLLVATALRHALHSPDASYLRRPLSGIPAVATADRRTSPW